ncbi:hypothetical protein QNO07_13580 [Streptomyces sp. 549]|uniref:hypothetical protein n=1 Tax=Streptomyces sp. 549 TaxID=3049076 RepID=UPI0024C33F76|nr:hypothetical protein [Streptomyces sp. 549]MDK1474438.1 hypothetical protein [Streptomyces sp. 549]
MTQPSTVPPPSAVPAPPPAPPAVREQASPPRRTAWAEGVDRLRAAVVTEPGRLRVIGAVLVALLLALGVVTVWQVSDRAAGADAVLHRSQPLSADAASIHRSLADANTTAAVGFLAGDDESPEVRKRYEDDIRTAARLITKAAGNSEGSPAARRHLAVLNEQLPVYTGLVESARTNNRQGLPIGGAYLRYADEQMREKLLPAARALYDTESAQLDRDHREAGTWPWAALALGVLTLAALGWAQRRHYLRTNRVFNRGLLAATAAAGVLVLWLAGGHAVARAQLGAADRDAARSLHTLNESLVAALEARGDENMTLVARGAGAGYEEAYLAGMRKLAGEDPEAAEGGLLQRAVELADDSGGRKPVLAAQREAGHWHARHGEVREAENTGEYATAVDLAIGSTGSTGEIFDRLDAGLRKAIAHEQRQFQESARAGRAALTGLAAGAGVAVLLGAAGVVGGIGRRLSEYR